MRVVGARRPREPGLRWPDAAEAAFLDRPFRDVLLRRPSGIVRYPGHAEAEAHMARLLDEEAARTPLVVPAGGGRG